MSLLSDVYQMGGDAVKNIFDVYFNNLPVGVGNGNPEPGQSAYTGLRDAAGVPSYRIKTFTVPSMGLMTYDIDYKTVKIKMPGGKIEFDPQFDTELRIDRYWQVYNDLVVWRNKLASPATGKIGNDVYNAANPKDPLNTRCQNVTVIASQLSGTGQTGAVDPKDMIQGWTFTMAFPMKVGDVGFDYAAGDNISMTITFGFVEMEDYHKGVKQI